MKLRLTLLLCLLTSFNANSYEVAHGIYTDHIFSDQYKDKATKEKRDYNEDNNMISIWGALDVEDGDKPFEDGITLKVGGGYFYNSFYEDAPFVGAIIDARQGIYTSKVFGRVETYTGVGAIITHAYEDMKFVPILVAHAGVRNSKFFINVGPYGLSAIVATAGITFD